MKIVLLLFMTFNICIAYSQAVYMKVSKSDGTSQYYPIQDIQKITFSGLTGISDPRQMNTVIKSFNVLKSYPNPFNSSTTIEYNILEKGLVKIMIFDINGKLIKVLFNENQISGRHQIIWNGNDNSGKALPGGIYSCIVNFQNKVLSNKLILIK